MVSEIEGTPSTVEDIEDENPDIATRLRKLSRRISNEKSISSLSFGSSERLSRSVSLVRSDNKVLD